MAKNYLGIEAECECGNVHTLLPMTVLINKLDDFIIYLKENQYGLIRIFVQKKYASFSEYKNFIELLENSQIKFNITEVENVNPEIYNADNILSVNEDYVIAFGDYKLLELAKYYACSLSVPVSFLLGRSFFDFTFSKFARIYDGVSYCFYQTTAPEFVIAFDDFIQELSIQKYKAYFKYKNIAYFENVLSEKIGDKGVCSKINTKLFKVKTKAGVIEKNKSILNLCLLIGRAMSLFNQTKAFFGAELEVANILEIKSGKSFLDMYILAGKVVSKIYENALMKRQSIGVLNLNKRIDNIKKMLSLSVTKVLQVVKKPKDILVLSKNEKIISALKFMLVSLIDSEIVCALEIVDEKTLISAIYLAPEFTSRYTYLNFIRDIGYLENLI